MMKKNFSAALISGLLIIAATPEYTHAQDYEAPQVTISREKTRMGGKLYYSHIVLEKQTLYSISKAYGVTVDDIYNANPGLKETGLKKNAVILIPEMSDQEPEKTRKKKSEKKEAEYITHTVRWYEDLDVIAEKYGVTVEAIMEFNDLKGRKLKNRQKLRIPPADQSPVLSPAGEASEPETGNDTGAANAGSSQTMPAEGAGDNTGSNILHLFRKNHVDISLLLPLNARDSTSGSRSSMDFYCGALLAARQLGVDGINIDLSVYDVADGQMAIDREKVNSSDVVIGPVSPGALGNLMSTIQNSTYVVSPLDHRAEKMALSYRNFIQAPSSSAAQYADLVDWIGEEKSPHDSVLVIYEKGTEEKAGIKVIADGLKENSIGFQTLSYSILEGRDIANTLRNKMTLTAKNHLMIASESEAFVNDVIRNINLMVHEKYDVAVYASSKIRGFETIEGENLHNANLHVSTSYYINYDQKEVQDFIMEYRALFNTEPTPFAFQGYDIMMYFAGICSKYGNAWTSMLPFEDEEMLQSGFKFSRVSVGMSEIGFVNTAIRRVTYGPDFSLSLSKGL